MSDMQVFESGPFKLESLQRPNGEIWFIAGDVCRGANVNNVSQAVSRLDDDEKGIILNDTLGGPQEVAIVSEAGLYKLLLSARKPTPGVKEFQRWVTHTVLPSIRSTGKYEVVPTPKIVPCWSDRIESTIADHERLVRRDHPGRWTTITAALVPILTLEKELILHEIEVMTSDSPDGSIGQCWANHYRDLNYPAVTRKARLFIPSRQFDAYVNVYEGWVRGEFDTWILRTYAPEKLPTYLENKYKKRYGPLPPASAADHACRTLTKERARLKDSIRRQLDAAGGFFPAGAKMPALEYEQRNMFDRLQ